MIDTMVSYTQGSNPRFEDWLTNGLHGASLSAEIHVKNAADDEKNGLHSRLNSGSLECWLLRTMRAALG